MMIQKDTQTEKRRGEFFVSLDWVVLGKVVLSFVPKDRPCPNHWLVDCQNLSHLLFGKLW